MEWFGYLIAAIGILGILGAGMVIFATFGVIDRINDDFFEEYYIDDEKEKKELEQDGN